MAEWRTCVGAHPHDWCVRHYKPQQLVKGMYVEFISDWTRHWPRSQLLILRNEDYKVAQQQHVDTVFKFLGGPGWARWGALSAASPLATTQPEASVRRLMMLPVAWPHVTPLAPMSSPRTPYLSGLRTVFLFSSR